LGVAFILRLLERAESTVAGVFLVAGFLGALGLPEYDGINADFALKPMNWPRVRSGARSFFVYGSDDDPYVPLERVEHIARQLTVPLIVIKQGGHLNAESGFTSFQYVLIDLQQLLTRPNEPLRAYCEVCAHLATGETRRRNPASFHPGAR
jgi:uncharacterized protein